MLNEDRGATLEAVVSRLKMLSRLPTLQQSPISRLRFVAVSATIPVRPSSPGLPAAYWSAGQRLQFPFNTAPCGPAAHRRTWPTSASGCRHRPVPCEPSATSTERSAGPLIPVPPAVAFVHILSSRRCVVPATLSQCKLSIHVHGYEHRGNDFLFIRNLKQFLPSILLQYKPEGKPALVFCPCAGPRRLGLPPPCKGPLGKAPRPWAKLPTAPAHYSQSRCDVLAAETDAAAPPPMRLGRGAGRARRWRTTRRCWRGGCRCRGRARGTRT